MINDLILSNIRLSVPAASPEACAGGGALPNSKLEEKDESFTDK
jgi:hypothetical protein